MRPVVTLALLALAAAPPAAAQTAALVQQCASFGEAQYKHNDRTVDRIFPGDFPAPALERFDAKAGSQAIAAALTLHGRMTYRNRRPALETHFVCLLDAMDRPLFFYALPALAPRPAPTPIVRGPPPPPPRDISTLPLPPSTRSGDASTDRPPAPPQAVQLRGLVREAAGQLQFSPCDGAPLALEDRTPEQELSRVLRELTAAQAGRPMFVEFLGHRHAGAAIVDALQVRRAAVETAGCRERFDQREWIAVGNEPPWRLEITARDMTMILPGVTALPAPRWQHGGVKRSGGIVLYAASGGSSLKVAIEEQRCIDISSGALFAYRIEVSNDGKSLVGCATHNPAMPAP